MAKTRLTIFTTTATLEAKTMALSRAQHEVIMLILLYCLRIYLPCWICFHFPFRGSTCRASTSIRPSSRKLHSTAANMTASAEWIELKSFAWKRGVVLAYLSAVSRTLMFLFLSAFVRNRPYSKVKMRNSKNVVRFLGEGIERKILLDGVFVFENACGVLELERKSNKEFIQRISRR